MRVPIAARANSRLRGGLLIGLLCGALGALLEVLPWGAALEENLGLSWLFRLRGPLAAPEDVVVISIDKRSSKRLGLPYDTAEWPRRHHTELLHGLHRAEARVVVFDLWFRRDQIDEDPALAAAMRQAGNILVLEHLTKCGEIGLSERPASDELDPCRDVLDERSSGPQNIAVHQLLPPNPTIAAAVAGSGPFTLPDRPQQVSQFWTFDQNAGGVPSLPMLALLLSAREELQAWYSGAAGDAADTAGDPGVDAVRRALEDDALTDAALALAGAVAGREPAELGLNETVLAGGRYLGPLIEGLRPPRSRYLNFYGPPLTLATLSYSDALERLRAGDPETLDYLRDKAVFVGLSSPVQWQQMDEFTTVFSDAESGHDISGIEILASAYANLLQGTSLKSLSTAQLLLGIFAWGIAIALLARLAPVLLGVPLVLAAAAGLLLVAVTVFAQQQLWWPIAVPLLVQAPIALLAATGLHYREAKRDRKRIHGLFRHYLPDEVVDRLVRQGNSLMEDQESVFGVSLHADAENYTGLSEGMEPTELAQFMNRYYEALFAPVRANQGNISDVVGDAMLAIWASRGNDREVRAQACRAALGMIEAMDEFSRRPGQPRLRSRVGIHCGELALAHVGAHDHYEYRAVGDIVNTSARLQELNKKTGTRVLVSAELIQGLDEFEFRPLGQQPLRGKETEIEVYELLGLAGGVHHQAH